MSTITSPAPAPPVDIAAEPDAGNGPGALPPAERQPAPTRQRQRPLRGPLEKIYAFWLAGMSCDGCSISVLGATAPSVESLLQGAVPGLPRLVLYHPVLSVEVGEEFMEMYHKAWRGELDAPYVIILEGSVPDERLAAATDGYWSALGATPGVDPYEARPIPTAEWLQRLAPGAAAALAIGTCATWGGVPAAAGNVTGSMRRSRCATASPRLESARVRAGSPTSLPDSPARRTASAGRIVPTARTSRVTAAFTARHRPLPAEAPPPECGMSI